MPGRRRVPPVLLISQSVTRIVSTRPTSSQTQYRSSLRPIINCSSFSPETVVIVSAEHKIVGQIKQESPFCPDIAATPDGTQVWLTLKDVGKTMAFNAGPPFEVIRVLDTGPITNHVNFARNANGQFAYVTI